MHAQQIPITPLSTTANPSCQNEEKQNQGIVSSSITEMKQVNFLSKKKAILPL